MNKKHQQQKLVPMRKVEMCTPLKGYLLLYNMTSM